MTAPSSVTPSHDPLAAKLSAADDRVLLKYEDAFALLECRAARLDFPNSLV
jgi:hypothetical protein